MSNEVAYQPIRIKDCDPSFVTDVEEHGGKNAHLCYQCGTCSGGCPVVFMMDKTPRKLIRMINLGMRDAVLATDTIWLCASCFTCTTRCPRGIDIAKVMTACRNIAIKDGIKVKNPRSPAFYQSFVDITEKNGKLFEPMLMAKIAYKVKGISVGAAKELLKDAPLGLELFKKGKLGIKPHKTKNMDQVKRIVKKAREMEAER